MDATQRNTKRVCMYNTQGQILCDGVNAKQNNGDIKCNTIECITPQNIDDEAKAKLTISKNEQLFQRLVDEKYTWK